jgi:acetylornithine deacetylase/succinyl-diaminopimelate desuccinylase-like protein
LINASSKILSYRWPFAPTAVASAYIDGIFKGKREKRYAFKNLKQALKNEKFKKYVEEIPLYNALLRNTVTPTLLSGGEKINVIPTEASVSFDARILPTENHDAFFKKIRRLAGKDVEVTRVDESDSKPAPSGYNTVFQGDQGCCSGHGRKTYAGTAVYHNRCHGPEVFQRPGCYGLWFFSYHAFG